ncbi:TonB-dependent receptor [Rheinheimera sp. SA_1]|nr:TonB-dependent receptor [Rheinheimera sp. SA_1]
MTRLSPITLAVVLAMQPQLVLAEENVAAAEAAVEVISVTGKKVAYANNVADESAKLQQASIGNVMDLIDKLPGVNVGQGDAFGSDDYTTTVSMRGFVIDRADQQLGITIDGIPNGGSAYAGGSKANRYLDSENTRLVEVGQGSGDISSASLDALGGTINFVSATPEDEQKARLDYSNGSFNARRYFARFDTGQLFGNTNAYVSLSDSYNSRWIGTGSNGYSDRLHFEAKSVTQLENSRFTGRISYDDAHEDNYDYRSLTQFKQNPKFDGLTNIWTGNPDIDQNFAEAWSTLRENTLAYLKGEFTLTDDLQLDVTPYVHLQEGRGDWLPPYQVYATDGKGNRITLGNGVKRETYNYVDAQGRPILDPKADTSKATRVSSYRHTHYDKDRFGFTSNLQWTLDSHQVRAGLWYEQQQRNQSRDWHQVLDPKVYHYFNDAPYWVQFNDDYENDVLKMYLQDKIQLGDLQLTVGVQQYLVDVSREDQFNAANNGKLDSDSDLLPSLGLVYALTNDIELFSGYSENFKAIPDTLLNTVGQDFNTLEPETAENLDLGLRYQGESLNASATLYSIKFNNRITLLAYQELDGAPDYLTELDGTFVNVGGVKSKGLEANADWRFSETFSLTSALTLNDSTYTENVNGYRAGDNVAAIPEKMLSMDLKYDQGNYRAGLGAKYTATYFGAAKRAVINNVAQWNRDEIPAYTLLNLYAGYRVDLAQGSAIQTLDLSFLLNNLTDKSYIAGGQEGAYLLGAERTASFTVSLGF